MPDDLVLVEHDGRLLVGSVLWRYVESGRMRALVRYETPSGVVVRRLHWADELWPTSEPEPDVRTGPAAPKPPAAPPGPPATDAAPARVLELRLRDLGLPTRP
jgi:hypothetical protein